MGRAAEHTVMNQLTTLTVRAACDRCGVVQMPGNALVLRVPRHVGQPEVRFTCPNCGRIQLQPVHDDAATALVGAAVTVERWQPPADLETPHPGSPFDEADMKTFGALLDDEVAFRVAVAGLTDPRAQDDGDA